MFGEFGVYVFKVFFVEFVVEVVGYFIFIERSVFVERIYKLDFVIGGKRGVEVTRVLENSVVVLFNLVASFEIGFVYRILKCGFSRGIGWD